MAYTRKFNKENENRPFPTRLRELAEKNNRSQAEIARHVGCTPQAIGAYMRGETIPKLTDAQQIADFFNVSLEYLSGQSDVPTRDETIQGICNSTRLSQYAVEKILAWNRSGFGDFAMEFISKMIESEDFTPNLIRAGMDFLIFTQNTVPNNSNDTPIIIEDNHVVLTDFETAKDFYLFTVQKLITDFVYTYFHMTEEGTDNA